MDRDEIIRRRLRTHALTRARFARPEDVVAWFGALQAQDYLGSLWAIGQRTRGAIETRIEDAETRRAIVRTWPMRGTLHFVAADDARWMTQLLAPRVIARNAARIKRDTGIDSRVMARCREVVVRTLAGGKRLVRTELYAALESRRIRTAGSRGLHMLGWLAQEGTICLAGRRGKQHTFALLDEWIPQSRRLDRDEALTELARRYFTSHGPATVQDFTWWSGLTAKDAQAAIGGAARFLQSATCDRRSWWWGAEAAAATRAPSRRAGPEVRLLPAYDEYTVAYQDRSLLVADPRHATGMGLLSPVILVDGRVAGTWKRTLSRNRASLETRLLRGLTPAERVALAKAVSAFGTFLGVEGHLAK